MQIIHGDYYHRQSMNNRIRVVPTDGPGEGYSTATVLFWRITACFHVGIVPQDVEDKNALFDYLGQVLDQGSGFFEAPI